MFISGSLAIIASKSGLGGAALAFFFLALEGSKSEIGRQPGLRSKEGKGETRTYGGVPSSQGLFVPVLHPPSLIRLFLAFFGGVTKASEEPSSDAARFLTEGTKKAGSAADLEVAALARALRATVGGTFSLLAVSRATLSSEASVVVVEGAAAGREGAVSAVSRTTVLATFEVFDGVADTVFLWSRAIAF